MKFIKIRDCIFSVQKYLSYLLVFLLPLQTRWIISAGVFNGGYFEYGTISLYVVDVLLIFILLLIAIYRIIIARSETTKQFQQSRHKVNTVWILIGVLELIIFISCFVASDKLVAFYTYGRFLLGVGLFYIFNQFVVVQRYNPLHSVPPPSKGEYDKSPFEGGVAVATGVVTPNQTTTQKSTLIYIFFTSTFFQSILAIYQIITQSTFANKWLGLAEHLPETLGTSVVELVDGTRWLRAYGGLDHPNMLGGLMVFAVLLVILELIKITNIHLNGSKAPINSPFEGGAPAGVGVVTLKYRIKFNLKIILLFLFLVTFTTTLFLTFSRSAWLATATGIVAILIFTVVKDYFLAQKRILQSILVVSLIFFALFIALNDQVQTRISADTRLEQKSAIERVDANKQAISIIKKNWLFGVGIGNYTQYLQKDDGDKPAYYYQPVHNTFLLIASEIGIVGLALMIFIIFYYFISQLSYHVINHMIYHMNSFLIIPLLVLFLFDHWLWSLHFGVLLFWFVLSFSYDEDNSKKG